MMWEYKLIEGFHAIVQMQLYTEGRQGWELVSVVQKEGSYLQVVAYLKRPLNGR